MEVESAVRRHLLNSDAVRGHVQDRVYKHRLEEAVPKGGHALVVTRQPGWATTMPRKTAEYPVVWVDVYSDPTRDGAGDIERLDAEDKGLSVARTLKRLLHGRRGEWWGSVGSNRGLMVVTSEQWQLPQILRDADRHRGDSMPALGDTVVVRTKWALQVAP